MASQNRHDLLERALSREKLARKQAEKLLEDKSAELYESNVKLKELNKNLNEEIENRTKKIQELAFLTKNNPEPVFIIEKTGTARPSNLAGEVLVPQKLNDQLKAELRRIKMASIEALTQNKKKDLIAQYNDSYYSISLVPKEELGIVIAYAKDITDQLQNLEKLKKAINEAENARLTEQYFIAQMSHEIRTPLNGIIGMSNILAEKSEESGIIKSLQDSAMYLNTLVGKVLDLSKLGSGNFEVKNEVFSFESIRKLLESTFLTLLAEKSMTLSIDIDEKIKKQYNGDFRSIVQILNNLLSNAIKYGREKVEIKIRVKQEKPDFEIIRIEVKDKGQGIPIKDQDKIFERYQRLANNTEEGFGIGLHVSLQFAKLLGGQLNLESSTSSGSTFVFETPLMQPIKEDFTAIPLRTSGELKGYKCLVAEDNEINFQYLKYFLDKLGIKTTWFRSGTELLTAIDGEEVDIILLDYKMPGLNGIEVCEVLRKKRYKLPIVLLTANAIPEQIELAKRAGIDSVLFKPFSPAGLESELTSLLLSETKSINAWEIFYNLGGNSNLAKEIFGHDVSYAAAMLEQIVEEFQNKIDNLYLLAENKEHRELQSSIHQLLASLGMLTLMDLKFEGEKLDGNLNDKNFDAWNEVEHWLGKLKNKQVLLNKLMK